MNYKVSDFVIRIKNASLAKRKKVLVPYCNINRVLGQVLVKEGFLENIKESEASHKKVLEAVIKYERRSPVLTDVLIVSKPSLRVYASASDIPEIQRRGRYTIILSTTKGVMTGKEAFKLGIGGEVLFKIW
jgi:small subunit ribosomal protein S8